MELTLELKEIYLKYLASIITGSPAPKLENLTFDQLASFYISIHTIKKWAYLDTQGLPNPTFQPSASYEFTLLAWNTLMHSNSAIDSAKLVIRQIDNPPPSLWLKSLQTTEPLFNQHLLDIATVFIYSTLDRALVLTNVILFLGLENWQCTYENIKRALRGKYPEILEQLKELRDAAAPLADDRNQFVHRGENRYVEIFSPVNRVKQIIDAFNMPTQGVQLSETQAKWSLQKTLRLDLARISDKFNDVKLTLCPHFVSQIERLGGVPSPSTEEIKRFLEVADYFQGGTKPEWMN